MIRSERNEKKKKKTNKKEKVRKRKRTRPRMSTAACHSGMRFQLWLPVDRFKSGSKAPHPIMCFLQIPTPSFNPRCFSSRNSNLPASCLATTLLLMLRTRLLLYLSPSYTVIPHRNSLLQVGRFQRPEVPFTRPSLIDADSFFSLSLRRFLFSSLLRDSSPSGIRTAPPKIGSLVKGDG